MPRNSKYCKFVKTRFDEIKQWIANGDTDQIVAKKLSIAESSFYEYQKKYLEFSELLTHAKKIERFENLENTLFRRAMGYMVQEKKVTKKNSHNGTVSSEEVETSRHIPADVAALKFILINQFSDKYKEKQTVDINGNMTINLGTLEENIL